MTLTTTQRKIRQILPATTSEIAREMGYTTNSTVYDHISAMKDRGLTITQNDFNEYIEVVPDGGSTTASVTNYQEPRRQTSAAKQTLTKKANEYLTELEREIKSYRDELGPVTAKDGLVSTPDGQDLVIHRTDDHFGDVVKDIDGNVVFNSEIAKQRVRAVFEEALEKATIRERMGSTIDTVHLLLGGDIVTNEAIYDGQSWEVEETIKEQMNLATGVYFDELERLAERFPSVQVACIGGNHGEFRVKGSSTDANADDLFYDRLEHMVGASTINNVTFVKSDRKDHVNFEMRDGLYTGHLRHGQNEREHIGTSSPKSDWRSFLLEYDFDISYRGHYHEYKSEPINGRPVIMGGSIKNTDEFEASIGAFSRPLSHIHGVNDETVLSWTDYIYH